MESTATGAAVLRHQTLIILSVLPAASSLLSSDTAMSEISAEAPRKVKYSLEDAGIYTLCRANLPLAVPHILTSRSSAPVNT